MLRIAILIFAATLLAACQSGDTITRICEDNNTECTQKCVITNANFSHTRLATQPVGDCDKRCETTYQACMKRQQNKSVKGLTSY